MCLFICLSIKMIYNEHVMCLIRHVLLARLYESTGRAIAITPASASVSALAFALLKC